MSPLLQIASKRILDGADMGAFAEDSKLRVPVLTRSTLPPGVPTGGGLAFLQPWLKSGAWFISTGFVEDVLIEGSGGPILGMGPLIKVFVECMITRDVAQQPLLPSDSEPRSYLTGRYRIQSAKIVFVPGDQFPQEEVSFESARTYKLLWQCDEDGNPPAISGSGHFEIEHSTLTLL